VTIRYLFGNKLQIALRASIIAKHSVVYYNAVGGQLIKNVMWNFGMEKEISADNGEAEPYVTIRMKSRNEM